MVSKRPEHLLTGGATWQDVLLRAVDSVIEDIHSEGGNLKDYRWGERNVSRVGHPLSRFLPIGQSWLDMPEQSLPGDWNMPRVQTPIMGASERMVVSPGKEELGIFHMPAGQSGHPLSPHYGDGHQAWAGGEPTPFLPGPPVHELVLKPADSPSPEE